MATQQIPEGLVEPGIGTKFLNLLPRKTLRELLRHRLSAIGLTYVSLIVFLGVFANVVA